MVGPSGDQNYVLYIGSSAGANALSVNSGGLLEMKGNVYNAKNITINTGGALRNDATSAGTQYIINGPGTITMAGGSISSQGGTWVNESNISGYGTISAPVINLTNGGATPGTITANNASPLSITGAFSNGTSSSHTAVLNVGTSTANPTGTLSVDSSGTLTNYGVLNVYGALNNNTSTAVA